MVLLLMALPPTSSASSRPSNEWMVMLPRATVFRQYSNANFCRCKLGPGGGMPLYTYFLKTETT